LVLGAFGFGASVQAGMIGDVLTIERLYPDLNTNYQVPPVSTVVTIGGADTVTVQNYELFNPEATRISIDWYGSSSYAGDATIFNGFRFTGFSNVVQNVKATDVTNISITELNFGSNFITLKLNGPFDNSSFLNLQVQFTPVPVPAALPLFFLQLSEYFLLPSVVRHIRLPLNY
jgi:hypothetical protein